MRSVEAAALLVHPSGIGDAAGPTDNIDARAIFLPVESIWPSAAAQGTLKLGKGSSESDFDSGKALGLDDAGKGQPETVAKGEL